MKPKIGLRTTRANEMWHIDTTVIRLLDGTRAYLHAVIDNFSRRILAWRVADTFAPVNSVTVLLDATPVPAPSDTAPVVLADAGVEDVNAQVDDLVRPPRNGLAVHLDRADVHPSAGPVAAARNEIAEAHFVDLAQVRGHPDLIKRARASERDHAHRIELHPANGRDGEFADCHHRDVL